MVIYSRFQPYLDLISQIDKWTSAITKFYGNHIICKAGCSECCSDDFSIFLVEAYNIYVSVIENKGTQKGNESASQNGCRFLNEDNHCRIYEYRPIICRTQGCPLIRASDSGSYELIYCQKNFYDINQDNYGSEEVFHNDYILPLDKINISLSAINLKFTENFKFNDILKNLITISTSERILLSDLFNSIYC